MNTLFQYQYRDAQNYKVWNEVILSGEITIEDLNPYLYEESFFVPSEVGLEDLQEMPLASYDHIWHEIIGVSPTSQVQTVEVSTEDLRQSFKIAKSRDWNQDEVFKRKGLI